MTIEEMKRRKTALGLTNEMIAQAAGVPLSTIQKIMSPAQHDPEDHERGYKGAEKADAGGH